MRKRAVALSVAVCLELEEGVVQRRGVTNTAIVTTNSSNDVEMESFMFPEIGEFKNANFELKKEGGKGEGGRGCKGEGGRSRAHLECYVSGQQDPNHCGSISSMHLKSVLRIITLQ